MNADELRKKWPAIESKLRVGDVLLFHKRKGPISRAIQRKTHSYWSHSALIFKDRKIIKYGSPLIIEAYNKGIEIHRLQKYTGEFDMYDIGVKRFKRLTSDDRTKIVESFMLNNIDVPYDYGRLITFYFADLLRTISESLYVFAFKHVIDENQYLCSTFVHKTFHAFEKHKVIKEKDAKFARYKQEEMVTPGMIAQDTEFEWIFNPND